MSWKSEWFTTKEHLKSKLIDYWRWVAEGKKKYKKEQWLYDPYHDCITYSPNEDIYYFDIQIFDSPEGDIWWKGTFKVEPNNDIKIIEENTIHR